MPVCIEVFTAFNDCTCSNTVPNWANLALIVVSVDGAVAVMLDGAVAFVVGAVDLPAEA
jgi:hypothetical protein